MMTTCFITLSLLMNDGSGGGLIVVNKAAIEAVVLDKNSSTITLTYSKLSVKETWQQIYSKRCEE